jgi:hypothetical protein
MNFSSNFESQLGVEVSIWRVTVSVIIEKKFVSVLLTSVMLGTYWALRRLNSVLGTIVAFFLMFSLVLVCI